MGDKSFQYHRNKRSDAHKLPFVTVNRKAMDASRRVDWFDVPTTDDYQIDNEIGGRCALAYLKFLRSCNEGDSCRLQYIVLSLLPDNHPKRGAIVGFFWLLDEWLRFAAVNAGSSLDRISKEDIENAVNKLLAAGTENDQEAIDRPVI